MCLPDGAHGHLTDPLSMFGRREAIAAIVPESARSHYNICDGAHQKVDFVYNVPVNHHTAIT
jgi:hypothetical protein